VVFKVGHLLLDHFLKKQLNKTSILKTIIMKTTITIIALFASLFTIAKTNNTASSYEVQGKEWYEKRAEGSVANEAKAEPINKAIAFYEKAMSIAPTEANVIMLLRCYYFKGSFVNLKSEERKAIFDKGKNLGEVMQKQYPRSAGIKYWLAGHYGKWAKEYGVFAAAKEGVADKVKELSEEVIKLDATYNDGGGYLVLGLVHFHSPRIPFLLSWPSNTLALENLQKAVKAAPTIGNTFCLAKAYLKEGKKDLGLALLKKASAMQPRAEKLVEDRDILKQIDETLKSA
jgi:tetratricopeptide (TPR) repeat protein